MAVEMPQSRDPRKVLFEHHPFLRIGENHTLSSVGRTLASDACHNLMIYQESRYDRSANKMGEKGFWEGFWDEAGRDYAALHLGVALQSLEDVMVDGGFNFAQHLTVYNNAVTGIWELQRRNIPEKSFTPVTPEKWRDMVAAAKEDPTFSVFFNSKRRLLPRKLRYFLQMTEAMPEIQAILPEYREYAEGVLGGYKQRIQDVEHHSRKLGEFDAMLAGFGVSRDGFVLKD